MTFQFLNFFKIANDLTSLGEGAGGFIHLHRG